tara:strand:- start:61 stop:246 length:186 start_codon:yes stop_codon:yes gene_type:complete
MEIKTIYIIYHIESNGYKYIEAITDDLQKWHKNHNKDRELEEREDLDDFVIETTTLQKFKK